MDPTSIAENEPGRIVLGRFELIERIGRGGFSTVYRAYDHKLAREVAVKAVRRTEDLTYRATREAHAAAKLSHPHIITVFELAEDDDEVYIVSELVKGRTLKRSLDEDELSDRDCLQIMLQVAEALGHAHLHGVIHRDIKPENIMLAEGRGWPRAKVMDFGIAQLENTQRITRSGDVVGTIPYMSPEQADGRAVDSATDVYSAALTLYECMTGANPFRGSTSAEIIGKIQKGALPLSHVRPELPEELSDLVEEAMDPDPQVRLGLSSFAAGLDRLIADFSGEGRMTAVIRSVKMPRPSFYDRIGGRYGFVASRAANMSLAALVAAAATYGSGFYPGSWRLSIVFAAALLVGLLPRAGLVALAGVAFFPVAGYSLALAIILAAAATAYLMAFGLVRPRVALMPALACGLGLLGVGLVYPGVAGGLGRLRSGLLLALFGGAAFTLFQLFTDAQNLDYLGISNDFGLRAELAGQSNPITVLVALVKPFRSQPALLLQPAIWLAAATPAALLIARRHLLVDISGLFLTNLLLAAGYFGLPRVLPGYVFNGAAFLKTLALCAIIQFGVLLVSPRTKPGSISPRERTKKT